MGITAINGRDITSSAFTPLDTTTGTGPYYLVFVNGTTGGRTPLVDSSTLTYNATSNTITATTFAGTASAANRVDVSISSNNATNYLVFTPTFNAGGTTNLPLSESGNCVFNPSSQEFRAGISNMQNGGQKSSTADANLTIDAATTQSMTWIASFTTTRSVIINNLDPGRQVFLYIRNTNATQRQISFSASATTTGHVPISMSVGAGTAGVSTQTIVATNGTMFTHLMNINANFVGGIM